MKKNIFINQEGFNKYASSLNIIDTSIMVYIYDLCASNHPAIEKNRVESTGRIWTWVDFSALIDNMPLLSFKTKGSLSLRVKKLINEELISVRFEPTTKGKRLYVRLKPKTSMIFLGEKINYGNKGGVLKIKRIYSYKKEDTNKLNTSKGSGASKEDFIFDEKEEKNKNSSSLKKKKKLSYTLPTKEEFKKTPTYKKRETYQPLNKHEEVIIKLAQRYNEYLMKTSRVSHKMAYLQGSKPKEGKSKRNWTIFTRLLEYLKENKITDVDTFFESQWTYLHKWKKDVKVSPSMFYNKKALERYNIYRKDYGIVSVGLNGVGSDKILMEANIKKIWGHGTRLLKKNPDISDYDLKKRMREIILYIASQWMFDPYYTYHNPVIKRFLANGINSDIKKKINQFLKEEVIPYGKKAINITSVMRDEVKKEFITEMKRIQKQSDNGEIHYAKILRGII